ncbi:MAG: APC family permease [Gammaproteobacteria bacterium]|nr:APC family permease [Gammaproteobacteria bacterium]
MKHHKLGLFSLIAVGIGPIIGSGWLFSSYYIAKGMQGAGAYAVWIVAAVALLILALMISEVVTRHPKRGAFTRIMTLAYNHDIGYITALANWFGMLVVIPVEASGTIQYISTVKPAWKATLFVNGQLTHTGTAMVALLIFSFMLLNFWGAKLLAKSNNLITTIKVCTPVIVSLIIIATAFHSSNFSQAHAHGGILPFHLENTFTMIMTGGVILAFNGFQCIASFAAEAKNPRRNIPRSLVVSLLIALAIYLVLQTAFIGALPTGMVNKGWGALNFSSPLAQLTTLIGLNVITLILYIDACLSPSGTGLVYSGTTGRMLTAMAQEKQAPAFFNFLHPKYHFSRRSLIFNTVVAIGMVTLFRNWRSLMIVVSQFHILSFMACPLAVMRIRLREGLGGEKNYVMPWAKLLCPFLFVVFTALYCSSNVQHLLFTSLVTLLFYSIYLVVNNERNLSKIRVALKRSYPFATYLLWLTVVDTLRNVHPSTANAAMGVHITFYSVLVASGLAFYYYMVYGYQRAEIISASTTTEGSGILTSGATA